MNPANWESTESGLSSHAVSFEMFTCREENFNNEETTCHVKRPSAVTFRDPEPSDVVLEKSEYSEVESTHVRPKAERLGKKGSCYRCLKGNRFTEKEVCIVCGAKYCSNCVLRAMGSMPEGRKCVPCIGFRVDDAKRGTLGKASRMLKRLLTEMEVKQIIISEISCQANQLPPEHVFVNGEPLSQKELDILQRCPNPPKKLNPGYYWYDKVSGFWGKVGKKPCQIISHQLNVGGQIMRNASNGNTNVLLNNREITKRELWMLQLAGVQCVGKPHFWMSADGSYQEEGVKNIQGCIWDKTGIMLVCAVLSLPTPPDPGSVDEVNAANSRYTEHFNEKDFNDEETPCHVKRPSVVTYRGPEPSDVVIEEYEYSDVSDVVLEESEYSEVESTHVRPKAERLGKKGSCYQCLKGNRFTQKEFCIVCGAKYCSNCVLTAMGSMPEGRKCVPCIGFRIDDAKRGTLGKASRMLKRLLTEMEVKQIMKSEISCQANQLPPELVFVNSKPLSQKELDLLQRCPNPPKKLIPGCYWSDKASGFWGKVGEKPCQIISPYMNVGGLIMRNASNGNTNVLVNNREITKRELQMLQLAGVQCEGNPHFWLSDDGSFQEEGMKNVIGRIWDKPRIKLVCALLSLPTPPDSVHPCDAEVNGANSNYPDHQAVYKLPLLGDNKICYDYHS